MTEKCVYTEDSTTTALCLYLDLCSVKSKISDSIIPPGTTFNCAA